MSTGKERHLQWLRERGVVTPGSPPEGFRVVVKRKDCKTCKPVTIRFDTKP
jgi:hypothetical protein